jgi:hypothetical protein
MELDLSLFGLHAQLYSLAEAPQPPPPASGLIYEGAIFSQYKLHLFVTPWAQRMAKPLDHPLFYNETAPFTGSAFLMSRKDSKTGQRSSLPGRRLESAPTEGQPRTGILSRY